MSVVELFCYVFTCELWSLIVEQTNQFTATKLNNTPCASPWIVMTIDEMKAFVGVLMLMGLLKLSRLEFDWSTCQPYIATLGISKIMPIEFDLNNCIGFSIYVRILTNFHLASLAMIVPVKFRNFFI